MKKITIIYVNMPIVKDIGYVRHELMYICGGKDSVKVETTNDITILKFINVVIINSKGVATTTYSKTVYIKPTQFAFFRTAEQPTDKNIIINDDGTGTLETIKDHQPKISLYNNFYNNAEVHIEVAPIEYIQFCEPEDILLIKYSNGLWIAPCVQNSYSSNGTGDGDCPLLKGGTIDGSLVVTQDVSIGSFLDVSDYAHIGGDVSIEGTLYVDSSIIGNSDVSINGMLINNGDISLGGGLISGDLKVFGSIIATGGIAAYSTSGATSPFLYNVTDVKTDKTETNYQSPSMKSYHKLLEWVLAIDTSVGSMSSDITTAKSDSATAKTDADTAKSNANSALTKLTSIKTALSSISSSSTVSLIGSALKNIYDNI